MTIAAVLSNARLWFVETTDVLAGLRSLPDCCVQCVVTSPPYYALRDYGIDGQIGLEETPDAYIAKMVEVFREVRRVLRDDGTLWLNIGDSYNAYNHNRGPSKSISAPSDVARPDSGWSDGQVESGCVQVGREQPNGEGNCVHGPIGHSGGREAGKAARGTPLLEPGLTCPRLKPKDLLGIPWQLAFALRADGWYLRSEIIWHKPNPMPESVTDRPSKAHEQVFLLVKSQRYFYDGDAVREANETGGEFITEENKRGGWRPDGGDDSELVGGKIENGRKARADGRFPRLLNPLGRNKRSVWSIPINGYKEAHFATFPTALPEICLKAGTSAKGCCSICGAPWQRVTESERVPTRPGDGSKVFGGTPNWSHVTGNRSEVLGDAKKLDSEIVGNRDPERHVTRTVTTGWQPGCECNGELWPCLTLDPFNGAGTTGLVASKGLGLRYIGFELNPEYSEMARRRINRGYIEPTPKVQSAVGQPSLFGDPA